MTLSGTVTPAAAIAPAAGGDLVHRQAAAVAEHELVDPLGVGDVTADGRAQERHADVGERPEERLLARAVALFADHRRIGVLLHDDVLAVELFERLEGATLEPMTTRGEDHMVDVRSYWHLHGDRVLVQSYRFARGGYRLVDALVCKRAGDDKLECADAEHQVRGF